MIGFETLKWGYLEPLPKRNFWVCLNSLDEIDLGRTENMNKKKSEKSSASIYKGGLGASEQQRGRKPRGVYPYWLFFIPKIDNHAKAT